MRRPNPSEVTKALVTALLPKTSVTGTHEETPYHDVVLQTSDNHKIPALKAVLAVRSSFFSRLLYGPFAESTSPTVAIDLTRCSLTQILHFIYSDDSPTLRHIDDAIRKAGHGFKLRRAAWGSLRCRDIEAAIDVVAAADYCQINTLINWGCSLIMKAVRVKQGLACIALQSISERSGVGNELTNVKEKLLQYIVRYVAGCFAVPFESERKTLAERECFGHGGKCGVMHLGEDTFKLVFERMKETKSAWRPTAVLFNALYFWATDGGLLSSLYENKNGAGNKETKPRQQKKDVQTLNGAKNDVNVVRDEKVTDVTVLGEVIQDPAVRQTSSRRRREIDKDSSRWKTAMACAEMTIAPTSLFLLSFMEPSGLLSQEALLRFYRDVIKRDVALESDIS